MADKTIGELVAASAVGPEDLFVLEQTGTAKKLTGQTLETWLLSFADGHGGIQTIEKTGSAGTNPVVDTYTITLSDASTVTFDVTNGVKGDTGQAWYVWIKYCAVRPTSSSTISDIPNNWMGVYSGTASTAPTSYTEYQWFEIKGQKGDTGVSIAEVQKTGGTGAPGTTDTYSVYLMNGAVAGQFTVYNGADGEGSPGSATPLGLAQSGVVGTALAYSREDHQHPYPSPSDIGAATPSVSFSVTLPATGWANNEQTISNARLFNSGFAYIASAAASSYSDYVDNGVRAMDVTTDGEITFVCDTAPSADVLVNIVGVVVSA